jgi:hypothetical protein
LPTEAPGASRNASRTGFNIGTAHRTVRGFSEVAGFLVLVLGPEVLSAPRLPFAALVCTVRLASRAARNTALAALFLGALRYARKTGFQLSSQLALVALLGSFFRGIMTRFLIISRI